MRSLGRSVLRLLSHPNRRRQLPGAGRSLPRLETLEDRLALSPVPPVLNSKLGAPATLFLDFNGHSQNSWGAYIDVHTPAYDLDGNPGSFNSLELASINVIWQRVAEDFAPFNLNVTTSYSGPFSNGIALRVAIGGSASDWYGSGVWGIGYPNSFTNSIANVVYVFSEDIEQHASNQAMLAANIANVASHEAGHGFGLQHQGVFGSDGTVIEEYNPGTSTWAPIMGASYHPKRTTWHNGQVGTRTIWIPGLPSVFPVYQDDMAVIARTANGFGFRADDHGNSFATATPLSSTNTGIIGQTSDVDVFSFYVHSFASVRLQLDVAAEGPNLDGRLELWSSTGQVFGADRDYVLSAAFEVSLARGTYFVIVRSHGNYGDVGQYKLTRTYTWFHSLSASTNIAGASETEPAMTEDISDAFVKATSLERLETVAPVLQMRPEQTRHSAPSPDGNRSGKLDFLIDELALSMLGQYGFRNETIL